MSLAPLDLIDAHPWQRVTFTTYAVSLSFFEAVILDRLVRGGGSQALILADVQGVRASFSEQGAQRVGTVAPSSALPEWWSKGLVSGGELFIGRTSIGRGIT